MFETVIGARRHLSARGIAGVQLPQASEGATRSRVRRRFLGAGEIMPPLAVQGQSRACARWLRGERCDLSANVIDDTDIPEFNRGVYAIVRKIQPGVTLANGEVAEQLGDKTPARAVGQAMRAGRRCSRICRWSPSAATSANRIDARRGLMLIVFT